MIPHTISGDGVLSVQSQHILQSEQFKREVKAMRKITIKTSGVMRCCLSCVGVHEETLEPREAINGDREKCKYCGTEFELVDNCWTPVWQIEAAMQEEEKS